MKNYSKYLLLIVVTFCVACSDDANVNYSQLFPPTVNGYYRRAENGSVLGKVGTVAPPETLENRGFDWFFCPNPSASIIYVSLSFHCDCNEKANIWIERAQASKYLLRNNIDANNMNLMAINSEIVYKANHNIIGGIQGFFIDVSKFGVGFYRIYVEIDNKISYDNLVVSSDY